MAFIEVPATIEAALKFLQEGSEMRNIINFRFPTVGAEESMDGLMTELQDWYSDVLTEVAASNVQFTGIKLTYLGVADGRVLEWSPSTAMHGATLSNSAPANVTLAVKMSTGHRGRSAQGRIYAVGIPEDVTSGSYISTTYRDALVAAWANLINPATIFAHKLCVVSRSHDNAPRTQGVTYDVTSLSADNIVDSQRRRLPGRGG